MPETDHEGQMPHKKRCPLNMAVLFGVFADVGGIFFYSRKKKKKQLTFYGNRALSISACEKTDGVSQTANFFFFYARSYFL